MNHVATRIAQGEGELTVEGFVLQVIALKDFLGGYRARSRGGVRVGEGRHGDDGSSSVALVILNRNGQNAIAVVVGDRHLGVVLGCIVRGALVHTITRALGHVLHELVPELARFVVGCTLFEVGCRVVQVVRKARHAIGGGCCVQLVLITCRGIRLHMHRRTVFRRERKVDLLAILPRTTHEGLA